MFVAAVAHVAYGATGFVLSSDTWSVAAERLSVARTRRVIERRGVVFVGGLSVKSVQSVRTR
jgi:predicted metal-dependent TIM-barrel fold hydrolase